MTVGKYMTWSAGIAGRRHEDFRDETKRGRCSRPYPDSPGSMSTAEEDLRDSLGRMGQLVKDTIIPYLDSNEACYLQGALDMIEEFQWRGSSPGTTEITLVERQG